MFTIDDSHILFTEPNQTFEHMSFWRPYMITRHAKCSCPIKEKITMKGACLVPYYTLLIVLTVCPLHCRFRDFLHNNFRKLHTDIEMIRRNLTWIDKIQIRMLNRLPSIDNCQDLLPKISCWLAH